MHKMVPWSQGQLTLPYAGPEDIPIIDIHHYPLSIQRVFINRAIAELARWTLTPSTTDM
jgi:hypothetical protein